MKKLLTIAALLISFSVSAQLNTLHRTGREAKRAVNTVNMHVRHAQNAAEEKQDAIETTKIIYAAFAGAKKKQQETISKTEEVSAANSSPTTQQNELWDMIKSLAPEATETLGNWQQTAINVTWKNAHPVLQNKNYVRNATSAITINNKPALCMNTVEGMEEPCAWNVQLSGNKSGYSQWAIFADDYHVEDQTKATQLLFPKAGNQLKILSKYDESLMDWFFVYEVTLPGKKVFYMRVEYFTGTATAAQAANVGHDSFSITCFLTKAQAIQ